MRFMVIVPAGPESEAGEMPDTEILEAMSRYNQELVSAGVMLAGEGLHPSSRGARVRFGDGGARTVVDGPFTEAKELVAGYWLLQTKTREECLEWVKRIPFQDGEVEVRQVFEAEDFGEEYTPELREQEDRMRAEIERQQG